VVAARTDASHLRLAEASALVLAGRDAEARRRLEQGLEALPRDGNLAHALARLLAASGDAAVRDGPRALEIARAIVAVSDAVLAARSGNGPTFIECVTYRIGAHSTSDDPTRYRSEEEVRQWSKKDPVDRFRKHLAYLGLLDDALDDKLDKAIGEEISQAIAEVERHGPPPRESLFDDVYARRPWHLEEERRELLAVDAAPRHLEGQRS